MKRAASPLAILAYSAAALTIISALAGNAADTAELPVASPSGLQAAPQPSPQERLNDAHAAVAQGDFRRAIALYTDLLQSERIDPSFLATVYRERGLANQMANNPSAAIADYTNAIWLNASTPALQAKSYVGRGLAYLSLNQLSQAGREFDAAIEIAPDLSEAYFGRATTKRLRGANDLAPADYTKALELGSPTPELVLFGRGLAYEALGQKASAAADFRQAVISKPGFTPAEERLVALNSGPKPVDQNAHPSARVAAATAQEPPIASLPDKAPDVIDDAAREAALGGRGEGGSAPGLAPGKLAQAAPPPSNASSPDEPTGALSSPPAGDPGAALTLGASGLRPSSDGVLSAPEAAPPPKVVVPPETLAAPPPSPPAAKAPPPRIALDEPPKAEAPARAAAAKRLSGTYIQLGSYGNRPAAETAKTGLPRKFPALASGPGALIEEADLGAKGRFFRLQVGPYADAAAASGACASLRKSGQACLVLPAK